MFERFTDRARFAIVTAEHLARQLGDTLIRPEHLLVSLSEGEGIAAKALAQLNVTTETLRAKVAQAFPPNEGATSPIKVPFSPRAKKALELSLREALQLGHNYIGTEHLLLGVVRLADAEHDTLSIESLLGVGAEQLRARVLQVLDTIAAPAPPRSPAVLELDRRARQLAGDEPLTTATLLLALLADPVSQASQALRSMGVTGEAVQAALEQTPLATSSDAAPVPISVEIKLGETTTTIEDDDVARALSKLSPEELREALRAAFGAKRRRRASGSGSSS